MATHPYISGPGNIAQTIALLRKNFPATVTSDTVKKYGIASNNESYVINALQFIGAIDKDGKRTEAGHGVFSIHDEKKFQEEFSKLITSAYADLFDIRGDDAWSLSKSDLIGYFRTADKTSDLIGSRQAGVFRVFAALAGHGDVPEPKAKAPAKVTAKPAKVAKPAKAVQPVTAKTIESSSISRRDMALTVRVEINLPAGGSRETYDAIFQSIRANLIDE
jgi:hypothetical protein